MGISNIGIDIIDINRFRKKEYIKNKKFLLILRLNIAYLLKIMKNILQENLL